MEYKVLTKEDRGWTGKFSPENLEHTLNSYAVEGWRVVTSFRWRVHGPFSTSQIMIPLSGRLQPADPPHPHPWRPPGHYTGNHPYRGGALRVQLSPWAIGLACSTGLCSHCR